MMIGIQRYINPALMYCTMLVPELVIFQGWTDTEAQRIALTLRAINYNVGVQMYTMVFITTLEGISSISHALNGEGDVIQSGVIATITDSLNGRW